VVAQDLIQYQTFVSEVLNILVILPKSLFLSQSHIGLCRYTNRDCSEAPLSERYILYKCFADINVDFSHKILHYNFSFGRGLS
jgi:hypothetical protein